MARGKEIDRTTVEMVIQMKKRNPKLTTEQIGAVVPYPEEKHDVEYPMANAAISWDQTFYSGEWNSAE